MPDPDGYVFKLVKLTGPLDKAEAAFEVAVPLPTQLPEKIK